MAGACLARENWEGKQRQGESKLPEKNQGEKSVSAGRMRLIFFDDPTPFVNF